MKRLMITAAVLLLSLLQTVCIYAESYEYDASRNMTGTQVYEPEEEKDVLQKIVDAAVQNAEKFLSRQTLQVMSCLGMLFG